MTNDETRAITVKVLTELLAEVEKQAKQDRDKVPLDAGEAQQRTWHHYNGKLAAMADVSGLLHLYMQTFPQPHNVETVSEGIADIRLSNQQMLRIVESDDLLSINILADNTVTIICKVMTQGIFVPVSLNYEGVRCRNLVTGLRGKTKPETDNGKD